MPPGADDDQGRRTQLRGDRSRWNTLVIRDERGTNELTVPADFRFTVDGKKMSVPELKAGMKGTATVTTTVKPVFVIEIKEASC